MGKKLAIWGSGNVCIQIMNEEIMKVPEYFIDNDLKKSGQLFFDKKIIHPSQIQNWKDVFVIVAIDNYSSVKEQLINVGLKEEQDFIWYREWMFTKSIEELLEEEAQFLCKIKDCKKYIGCKLIFSDFLAFDKGVCGFVNKWNKSDADLVLCSEAGWVGENAAKEKLDIPVVKLPGILSHNQYIKEKDERIYDRRKTEYVRSKEYLKEAAANLRMGYPDMAENYEYTVCFCADQVIREMIEYWKPSLVILWNSFYAFHVIIRNVCNEKRIPMKYMEFGNIPGTIILEETGQMGESWPARYPQKFMEIPVSDEEFDKAEKLIEELRIKKLNRNAQPHNNLLADAAKKLKPDRPVIFYAGQNDNASGMQPYTENSRKFHSPAFTSSDEAAVYLAGLCEKNDWNYIYKPHPMMVKCCNHAILPGNTIVVDHVNINDLIDLSDVVVTILSTVSYIALIREKPVLMLGYTQLKGKGCTYEAFEKERIEEKLCMALEHTSEQKMNMNFIRHIAQLIKFYSKFMRQEEVDEEVI